jgi:dTDP-4-dehydrorhamnose reductase
MNLLLFGRSGQVATEIRRLAGPDLLVTALGRAEADLSDPERCAAAIEAAAAGGRAPDAVVNAAAYTSVDRAETEEALATAINGDAPGAMARAAARRNIPFLHISTDYVFDGRKEGAWTEDDPPAPLSAYGRSKLAGERAVAEAGGRHLVLRTSWVHAGHGGNFVRAMLRAGLRAAATGERLRVVDDQRGGPTAAGDIARTLVLVARAFAAGRGVSGLFHYCGAPAASWYGFAREIFAQARWVPAPEIVPIRTADWPTAAARPANSVLDCTRIRAAYAACGVGQPDWRTSLGPIVAEQEAALRAECGAPDGPAGGPGCGPRRALPVGKTG